MGVSAFRVSSRCKCPRPAGHRDAGAPVGSWVVGVRAFAPRWVAATRPRTTSVKGSGGVLVVCLLAMAGEAVVVAAEPATGTTFLAARSHLLKGEFDQAIAMYEALGSDTRNAVAAACGRAEVDLQVGQYVEGVARLDAVEQPGRSSADWHACRAALLAETGDYAAAIRHDRRAVALDATRLRAHWQLGRALEATGRTHEAIEAYAVFDEAMTESPLPEDAESLTWLGLGFYRYSILTRDSNLVQRTRHVLTEVFQEAFDFVEPAYGPARLAAGELLLSKSKLPEARAEFERALARNPKAADAMVGLGRIALEDRAFEEVEKQAGAALSVNSNHVRAMLLLADARMIERRYAEAAASAREALSVNPNSLAALGASAAAATQLGDAVAAADALNRARRINPRPAMFHYTMGRWLSASRQYAAAEAQLKKAIEAAPTWPDPRTELGLLHMETGEGKSARRMLDASFELDSFDLRTHAALQCLDRLDGFARLESEHFVIRYDAEQDAIVAPYFSEALEGLFEELCERYGFRPQTRTTVEVYSRPEDFSARTRGQPFIRTIGASVDRVMTLPAPRGEPPIGRYNWASALRHEFTHVVTLGATRSRIPHWMTEGLATSEEPGPRTWETKQLLSDAVRQGRLFSLSSIDERFIRRRRPNDLALAQAQSEWMVEYILQGSRNSPVLALLKAFGEGKSQRQAFVDVLKIEPEAFDTAFARWARGQVKRWGLPVASVGDAAELEKQLQTQPSDAALWGQLAQARWLDGLADEAATAARRALTSDKNQTAALEVIGHVLMARALGEKQPTVRRDLIDEAEPFVRRWHESDPENPAAMKYLAQVEEAWEQWPEAIHLYRRYLRRFPEDPDSYRRLAGIFLREKKTDAALAQLESLARLADSEPTVPRRVGKMYSERGDPANAAQAYLQAMHIDPYDVDTHGALADAWAETGAYASARREYEVVTKLLPTEPIGWDGLARVCEAMGNSERAATYQKRAEALRGKERERQKIPGGMDLQ